MSVAMIRYRVRPGHAEENAALVRAVYAELEVVRPAGLRYATFLLEDGESFVHLAFTEPDAEAPLTSLASFGAFRAGLEERCAEPPVATSLATRIGGYGL